MRVEWGDKMKIGKKKKKKGGNSGPDCLDGSSPRIPNARDLGNKF